MRVFLTLGLFLCVAACGGDGSGEAGAQQNLFGADLVVERIAVPSAAGSGQAHLVSINSQVLLSWLEPVGESERALRYAMLDSSGSWTEPVTVAVRERFFVNWADFPSVVPISESLWVSHWLELQPDSYGAYDAVVAVSTDAGNSWTDGEKLNEDQTVAEHGFVEIFSTENGARALWLDGREMANWSFDNPEQLLGVSLRSASVEPSGAVVDRQIVDPMVCDCCQPDVVASNGQPILVYRDRSEEEIRDIAIRRSLDGAWEEARNIGGEGWMIEGCPVNGPAIAASEDDIHVAWFTAEGQNPRVRYAASADSAGTFSDPIDIDADGALGQVDVVAVDGGGAWLTWWRRGVNGGIDLVLGSVSPEGMSNELLVVASEDVSQPVDVPQLQPLEDGLVVVWTSFEGDGMLKAARVEVAN